MKTRLVKLIALGFLLAVTNFAYGISSNPEVIWFTNDIDFGSLQVGTSSTVTSDLQIFCKDTCDFNLEFDSGLLDFFVNPTTGTVPGFGISTVSIDLMFAPNSIGTQNDILTAIVTDLSGNTANAQLSLTGTGVVPVPAAVWLFGSGLLGLVGMARRKKTA